MGSQRKREYPAGVKIVECHPPIKTFLIYFFFGNFDFNKKKKKSPILGEYMSW